MRLTLLTVILRHDLLIYLTCIKNLFFSKSVILIEFDYMKKLIEFGTPHDMSDNKRLSQMRFTCTLSQRKVNIVENNY